MTAPSPSPSGSETVGFIGLGQIGTPMARHLTDRPGGLVVCDTREEAVRPLVRAGAKAVATPREMAAAVTLVSVMVRDDEQVREVVAGPTGLLSGARPGTIVAIHSTIQPSTAEELDVLAEPYGVEVVDAPVSGGAIGAGAGSLAVMIGGTPTAFQRCREPFATFADLIEHLGPVGAGTRAKLARNLLHFTAFTAASEAQRLAEACGLDLPTLARVVRHSDAETGGVASIMFRATTAQLDPADPLHPLLAHARDLGEKDLTLALQLADELGLDLPLARLARQNLAAGLGVAHPESDGSAAS